MPKFLPWLNWGVATSFALLQFFLQAASGLMAGGWRRDFQLNSAEIGALSAAFFMSYVVMQIPVGLAYDRYGTRKILILASILLALGSFSLAFSQAYWQAFLARLIMGSGSAFGFIGMLYVIASWFPPRHFTLLVGISETLAMLGVAAGEIGIAWIVTFSGWRMTMVIAGFSAILVTLIVILIVQDKLKEEVVKTSHRPSFYTVFKEVIMNKQLWLAGYYGFAMFSIVNVIATLWGVPFFLHVYMFSLHTAGSLIAMVFIGIAIGGPFNAWLILRGCNRAAVMFFFASTTTILFIILFYIPALPLWSLYFLLLFIGFFSSSYIQTFAVVKDSVSFSLQATALSTVNMILMMSAPILQPLVGKFLALSYTFPKALAIILITLVLNVFLSTRIDKK